VKLFAIRSRRSTRGGQPANLRRGEEGYILLTMLLVVALMSILALTVYTEMKFTMKRDQEGEMIHRGVQYSRAIRAYYKKFGRYPTRLEDLDNTNNLRFLRKHYKDPVTGRDFRLLHFGEQGVTVGAGGLSFGGGQIPGATPAGAPGGLSSGPGNSAFGNGNSSFGNSSFGNSNSGANSNGVFAQSSGSGGNSNSAFGGNSNSNSTGTGNPNSTGGKPADGTDPSQGSSDDSASAKVNPNGATDISSGQQPVSGGPIVGVASLSKLPSIREFNKKRKYNEWQFVYDPTNEPRNGLITTPNQPQLQGFGNQPNLNGAQGSQPGNSNGSAFGQSNGFGQSNSFGQSNGFGNNSNQQPPQAPPLVTPPQQQ
jgi:type II secretory pathway pseudopilin PulG